MRHISIVFLLLLFSSAVSAQLINFSESLFNIEGFFFQKEVKAKKIRFIRIAKSDKQDGKIFQNEVPMLLYNFSKDGVLVKAEKYIFLHQKIDTARVDFFYDNQLMLYKKIERQGPFRFDFHFQYVNNRLHKAVKLDGNNQKAAPAYVRFFEHSVSENKLSTTVLNTAQKAFQTKLEETDNKGRITKEHTQFVRNSNYFTVLYSYQQNRLIGRKEVSFLGELNENKWTFSYKNNRVEEIYLFNGLEKLKKYAVIYEQGLPSAIVERNIAKKEVVVYRFKYTYYN